MAPFRSGQGMKIIVPEPFKWSVTETRISVADTDPTLKSKCGSGSLVFNINIIYRFESTYFVIFLLENSITIEKKDLFVGGGVDLTSDYSLYRYSP